MTCVALTCILHWRPILEKKPFFPKKNPNFGRIKALSRYATVLYAFYSEFSIFYFQKALEVIDTKRYFSNHAIGERNLCLSILSKQAGQTVFYVPNQKRDSVVGFVFKDNRLQEVERRSHTTDFSQSLTSQLAIPQTLEGVAELNGLNSPPLEGCPLGRGGF